MPFQSWRRRPGGHKTTKRAAVSMEQLDHRQLLSVNFTGNVATDFPATQQPGVVVIPATTQSAVAGLPPDLQNVIGVSGFTLSGIRVSYSASDDVLSIGIDQPQANQGKPGLPPSNFSVIAGDADNNGDDGTVSPAVQALRPGQFDDPPEFGGSETMGAFLDLTGNGFADVVAGYSFNDPRVPKQYQVAQAIVNPNAPPTTPGFGTPLPQFTGNVYKVNSPVHPNLEFSINHFSQLYLQETGQTLTPDKVISFGAFAGSGEDDGVGEAFFPQVPVTFGNTIVPPPPPPPVCPPVSPPVQINPHENHHINTAHPTDIRVSILGTSGFDVTQINPATVRFGGAAPVFNYFRKVNNDQFLDETFVFKGTDVKLPPGIIEAPISGSLVNGQTFVTSMKVFNRDFSFYSPAAVAQARADRLRIRTGSRPRSRCSSGDSQRTIISPRPPPRSPSRRDQPPSRSAPLESRSPRRPPRPKSSRSDVGNLPAPVHIKLRVSRQSSNPA